MLPIQNESKGCFWDLKNAIMLGIKNSINNFYKYNNLEEIQVIEQD